jgi:hypothetical protein
MASLWETSVFWLSVSGYDIYLSDSDIVCFQVIFTVFVSFPVFYCLELFLGLCQGCTNPECQIVIATKFYTVKPNICGSSIWNFLHVTFFMLLSWRLQFLKQILYFSNILLPLHVLHIGLVTLLNFCVYSVVLFVSTGLFFFVPGSLQNWGGGGVVGLEVTDDHLNSELMFPLSPMFSCKCINLNTGLF